MTRQYKIEHRLEKLKKEHSVSQTLLGKPMLGSHLNMAFWATSVLAWETL